MEDAVNELSQAIGLTILNHIEILQEVAQSMNGNVEFLVSNANLIAERTSTIDTNTTKLIDQNSELSSKLETATDLQRETLDAMAEQSRTLNEIVAYLGSVQMGEKFGDGFQASLLKMNVLRLRLSRWARSIGLEDLKDVKSCTKFSPDDLSQVEELLSGITGQFSFAEGISKRLQRRNPSVQLLEPAKELDRVGTSLHQTMTDLVRQRQGNQDLETTTGLTLYEERNFTQLIDSVSGLVEELIQLFPEAKEGQRALCKEEVAEMGKINGALPLLKKVAGDDKLLTEMVEKVIQSTATTYNTNVVFSGDNSGFQIGYNNGTISDFRFR
ncbi:hypothetical protein N7495_005006 [Penicillium taxi]|uniref:uncharacterized protein n=1 Tax=Penicillium taxi TaxID=168475 RepID=UPI002545A549|nr:uncharacterized protein N7495_005006 [Penicillium taxi]KAJ5893315.1 hypothetical protein N7495_005006 [Penicillium taxi]